MWNYLWIPFLVALSNELVLAKAQFPTILLPGQNPHLKYSSCPAPEPTLNFRPVIGILTHPGDGASGRLSNDTNASYIAASYVKFAEAAGARVIPLIYNELPQILFDKLNLVNGVIFTGGWANSGLYFEVVEGIFKKILEKNDRGDHFPLLAICLGFELITMIVSKDKNILEYFNAKNQASTLHFGRNINIEGTMFQRSTNERLKTFMRLENTITYHMERLLTKAIEGITGKMDGSLSIQDLALFNTILLCKWCWRSHKGKDSLRAVTPSQQSTIFGILNGCHLHVDPILDYAFGVLL